MPFHISTWEILGRLILTVLLTGIIGYDREQKNHPAGMRTYILVGVGACIIALIQKDIGFNALNIAHKYPQYSGVIRADDARLIAQVVSGVGFIGAGTIIIQRRNVLGLTSAATIWAVSGLGLAVGMGNYEIAIAGTTVIFVVLTLLKRMVHVGHVKKILIKYRHRITTKEFIQDYFDKKKIKIDDVDFNVTQNDSDDQIYTNIYQIDLPRDLSYAQVIEDISMNKNVLQIKTVNV